MSTISCGYRIYPAWFGDEDILRPMHETADHAARNMGRAVLHVTTTGYGFDRRGGHFIDFKVTYSSTSVLKEVSGG